ncbi:MAG TPA: hypothetical protein VK698_02545 [Kofleriaceae bacterium]|nr:hypothetical protein [Kofleriaceae bacterium]
MNPILHWVVARTVARRMRRCTRCGHSQTVSLTRERESVPCDRCKTPLPPQQPARR